MAYYPSSVKNDFTTKVNFSDTILAAHVNDLQAEVTAIETNVGTSANVSSGWIGSFDQVTTTWSTLKDRLNNIEYGLNIAYSGKMPTGGSTGQLLIKNSGSDYDASWATFTGLPSQSSNSGKYLTTDGSSASWSSINQVPSVSGNSGKYLYTDGSTSSWVDLTGTLPSQSGNNGKYLTTDGSSASWVTIATPTTDETISSFLLCGC